MPQCVLIRCFTAQWVSTPEGFENIWLIGHAESNSVCSHFRLWIERKFNWITWRKGLTGSSDGRIADVNELWIGFRRNGNFGLIWTVAFLECLDSGKRFWFLKYLKPDATFYQTLPTVIKFLLKFRHLLIANLAFNSNESFYRRNH